MLATSFCPVGRLTMDPDVMADPGLRRPAEDAFAALRNRLAEVLDEGRRIGRAVHEALIDAIGIPADWSFGNVVAQYLERD